MKKRIIVGTGALLVTAAAILISSGVMSAQAGREVTNNPEQTAYFEPEDSKPTISAQDALQERVKNFPPLQPYDESAPLIEVGVLLPYARSMSLASGDGKSSDAPAFAAKLAYSDLTRLSPGLGGDPQIAPDRPVWVLTIHDSIQNWGAPYGYPNVVHDVYSVVYDGPTGDLISFGTGEDIEKLGVPGEYLE